jgi:hypothetical protein
VTFRNCSFKNCTFDGEKVAWLCTCGHATEAEHLAFMREQFKGWTVHTNSLFSHDELAKFFPPEHPRLARYRAAKRACR